MNLWVNRFRQLSLLTVALFFFACEDDLNRNGFQNPNPKFKGKYIEFPLETSNLLLGNIRTSNNYFTGETNRFLIGGYEDPAFGRVRSTAIGQFISNSGTKLPADSEVTGVTIQVALDLTVYGSASTGDQTFTIHELLEEQSPSKKRFAYSDTVIPFEANPVAEGTFNINPALLKEYADQQTDTVVVLKFPVSTTSSFYNRLKQSFLDFSTTPSLDSGFVKYDEFAEAFPGLAIVGAEGNTVVLGASMASSSGVVIHFKTTTSNGEVNGTHTLGFSNPFLFSYNRISTERIGDLAGILPFEQQSTEAGSRYIQAGTGQAVKLNLDKFLEFVNENAGKNLVLNSAELIIDEVDVASSTFITPPRSLGLRLLGEDNRLVKYLPSDAVQTRDLLLFQSLVNTDYTIFEGSQLARKTVYNNDSTFYIVNDSGQPNALSYNSTNRRYSGFLTMLLQRLYRQPEEATRYRNFVLYPIDASNTDLAAKAVHRTLFNSEKVMLRIYYTEPTVNQD